MLIIIIMAYVFQMDLLQSAYPYECHISLWKYNLFIHKVISADFNGLTQQGI